MTYNFPLLDVVEEDEVTEHGDEAEQAQARHDVDHGVLQVKLPWDSKYLNHHSLKRRDALFSI